MFHTPAAGTRFYRVTWRGMRHRDVLSGMGSYYTLGGRYHRPHQRTVYASDDALVSISEMAYYQALEWQERIGGRRGGTPVAPPRPAAPAYPFVSSHLLWCFTLKVPPPVIELDNPVAYTTFGHTRIEILNPGQAYETTQSIADRIRPFTHPVHPQPEGLKTPSVRTPISGVYHPSQYALFVKGGSLGGKVVWKADLTLEFLDRAGNSVNPGTHELDWTRPMFQLQGLPAPIPAFVARPGAHDYTSGPWYPAEFRPM